MPSKILGGRPSWVRSVLPSTRSNLVDVAAPAKRSAGRDVYLAPQELMCLSDTPSKSREGSVEACALLLCIQRLSLSPAKSPRLYDAEGTSSAVPHAVKFVCAFRLVAETTAVCPEAQPNAPGVYVPPLGLPAVP